MSSESRRETLIVVNPAAHNVPSRKRLDEAERWLGSQGWQVERRQTEGPRQATELAAAGAGRGRPPLFVGGGGGPAQAVKAAVEGDRRRIDLGRAGDRYFLLMAGYGLDGAIARRVHLGLKSRLGAATHAAAAARGAAPAEGGGGWGPPAGTRRRSNGTATSPNSPPPWWRWRPARSGWPCRRG